MADKTDLNIVSTDPTGKKQTTKISYVNPEASATQLYQLATQLMNTSQNTYQESSRVDTTEIIDESALLNRNMQFESSGTDTKNITRTIAEIKSATDDLKLFEIGIRFSGQGTPYIKSTTSSVAVAVAPYEEEGNIGYSFIASAPSTAFSGDNPYIGATGIITVAIDAGDGYKSDEITLTITA